MQEYVPNSDPFGYAGWVSKNPYLYSLPAATWMQLVSEANESFGGVQQGICTETPIQLTTESGVYLTTESDVFCDGYFDSWLLAIIARTWYGYIISGPTEFSWGQVVLANPACNQQVGPGSVLVSTNEVYNPNLGKISVFNSCALYFVPIDYPAGTINPI